LETCGTIDTDPVVPDRRMLDMINVGEIAELNADAETVDIGPLDCSLPGFNEQPYGGTRRAGPDQMELLPGDKIVAVRAIRVAGYNRDCSSRRASRDQG